MNEQPTPPEKEALDRERFEVLQQVEDWLELPVMILGFVWLVLLVVEFIWGVTPLLEGIVFLIWGIFILDFAIRFILAPYKLKYLRNNWLTVLSLMVPALRVLRIAQLARVLSLARATRGLRLFRLVSSLNRGIRALRSSMGRRGFGYVILLSVVILLVGAAGIFTLEGGILAGGIEDYGDALWWTAMMITTMGSDYWPQTAEGRILAFLLALYAFAVFGYVTAFLATFFIGREAESEESEVAGARTIEGLRAEIQALRAEIRALSEKE